MNTEYEFLDKFYYIPYNDYPVFCLKLYDTFRRDSYGKHILAYEFYQDNDLIFSGNDFHCSPLHAIDSNDTANDLLSFLSLQPGDTDDEYFNDYTDKQMEFCLEHGEALRSLLDE